MSGPMPNAPPPTELYFQSFMSTAVDGHRASGQGLILEHAAPLSALRVILVFSTLSLVLVFSMVIGKDLDVDEHGFIASGVLLARDAKLPYRDYHYNHMPTEVLVYAVLFRVFDHLVM